MLVVAANDREQEAFGIFLLLDDVEHGAVGTLENQAPLDLFFIAGVRGEEHQVRGITHHHDFLEVALEVHVHAEFALLVLCIEWHLLDSLSDFPVFIAALR